MVRAKSVRPSTLSGSRRDFAAIWSGSGHRARLDALEQLVLPRSPIVTVSDSTDHAKNVQVRVRRTSSNNVEQRHVLWRHTITCRLANGALQNIPESCIQ